MAIIEVDIKDSIATWWGKTNELGTAIGDLANLADSDLIIAINNLKGTLSTLDSDFTNVNTDIGDLNTLDSDYTTLVEAVNALIVGGGVVDSDLSNITTLINNLDSDLTVLTSTVSGIDSDLTVLTSTVSGIDSDLTNNISVVNAMDSDLNALELGIGDLNTLDSDYTTLVEAVNTLLQGDNTNETVEWGS